MFTAWIVIMRFIDFFSANSVTERNTAIHFSTNKICISSLSLTSKDATQKGIYIVSPYLTSVNN